MDPVASLAYIDLYLKPSKPLRIIFTIDLSVPLDLLHEALFSLPICPRVEVLRSVPSQCVNLVTN